MLRPRVARGQLLESYAKQAVAVAAGRPIFPRPTLFPMKTLEGYNPFRTAVSFGGGGQIIYNLSGSSPNRDCSTKWVKRSNLTGPLDLWC